MKVLTIVLDNRPALLAELATRLESESVDVREINADVNGDQVVITLRAHPWKTCHKVLTDHGLEVAISDHLLIEVEDRPGVLADLSRKLANDQVDILSIHVVHRENGRCRLALKTDNPYRAGQILHAQKVKE